MRELKDQDVKIQASKCLLFKSKLSWSLHFMKRFLVESISYVMNIKAFRTTPEEYWRVKKIKNFIKLAKPLYELL